MKRLRWGVFAVVPVVLVAACGGQGEEAAAPSAAAASEEGEHAEEEAPEGAEEVDDPQPRLVVADGAEGLVTLLDLTSGEEVQAVEVAEPVYLSTSEDGRLAYLIQYESGAVDVLATGSWTVDHGDHDHYYTEEAGLLDPFEGDTPSHVVSHHGTTAVFTDGDGIATLLEEDALAEGEETGTPIETGTPHHGVAIALEDAAVVTLPDPEAEEGELPYGVTVRDEAGEVVAESTECPELHGEVTTGEGLAFACADGVLVVEPDGADSEFRTVAYPEGADGLRAWSLVGEESGDVVYGILANDDGNAPSIARLDLASGQAQRIELPAVPNALALDPANDALLVVTADGQVHALDSGTGQVLASAPAVAAFKPGSEEPTPQLAVGEDRVYVSDPSAGTVIELATNDDLRVARTLDVGGAPQRLAVTS